MKKPVIAVDIDDVLFPNSFRLLEAYNKTHQAQVLHAGTMNAGKIKGMLEHIQEHSPELDRDAIIDRLEAIITGDEFHDVVPLDSSIEVIKRLAKQYDLVAVSSRPKVIEAQTIAWLDLNYPGLFKDIHVLGKRWGTGINVDKSKLLKDLGTEYIIDDLLGHVLAAVKIGIRGIVFGNYPWNQIDELPEGVTRCKDWQEVLEYFDV